MGFLALMGLAALVIGGPAVRRDLRDRRWVLAAHDVLFILTSALAFLVMYAVFSFFGL